MIRNFVKNKLCKNIRLYFMWISLIGVIITHIAGKAEIFIWTIVFEVDIKAALQFGIWRAEFGTGFWLGIWSREILRANISKHQIPRWNFPRCVLQMRISVHSTFLRIPVFWFIVTDYNTRILAQLSVRYLAIVNIESAHCVFCHLLKWTRTLSSCV